MKRNLSLINHIIANPSFFKEAAKILIIEDNSDIREILCEILTDEGFTVNSVKNGQQALDYLAAHPLNTPDLIFLDLMMPVMSGYQFLVSLKLNYQEFNIPIIILSAEMNVTPNNLVVANLSKPVDIKEFIHHAIKFSNITEDICSLI